MNIQTHLSLKSQDTALLFKINIGNKPLCSQAMQKLAILYTRSEEGYVYAFLKLMEIKRLLETTIEWLYQDKAYFTKKSKKLANIKVTFPIQVKQTFEAGTPLHFEMIRAVQLFDEVMCLLRLLKTGGLFAHQNIFFKKRNVIKKRFYTMITQLACIKTQHFPTVTLDDYFANNEAYQSANKIYGEVDPTLLYLALQSDITPALPAKELNEWLGRLKENIG